MSAIFGFSVVRWNGKKLERRDLRFTSGIPSKIVARELPPLQAEGWVLSGDANLRRAKAAYRQRQEVTP